MRETGRTDLAPVWAVRAVGDEVDTHLTLGSLNRRVSLAWRDGVALAKDLLANFSGFGWGKACTGDTYLEVMDQRLHALLHGRTRWWDELVVVNFVRAGGHLVQALHFRHRRVQCRSWFPEKLRACLVDDMERLPELLYTAEVPVVAIAVLANRDVELDLRADPQRNPDR